MIRRLAARALRGVATEVEIIEVQLGRTASACGWATDRLDALAGAVLGCGCTADAAEGCGKTEIWAEGSELRCTPCPCPCHAPGLPAREHVARALRWGSERLSRLDELAAPISPRLERTLYEACGRLNHLSGVIAGCGCSGTKQIDCARCDGAEPCRCHGRPS